MIPERSADVLRAIVQDYIATHEPVGSKALVERHGFGVSAATIRNDMAILEEEELIVAPHTSSGRVPTDKGYRLFVDRLNEVKPLSTAERTAIESFMASSADLDEVLNRTVRLLSSLTNQMAVLQYPSLGRALIKNIETVQISDTRVLLILVTDTGRHQDVVLELGDGFDLAFLAELRAKLLTRLTGVPLNQVAQELADFELGFAPNRRALTHEFAAGVLDLVDANRTEKIIVSGAANLARREAELGGNITSMLEAIEQQVVMLKLITELDQPGVAVRIGRENQMDTFANTSLIMGAYQDESAEVAKLGVIGPTRMNYSTNIAAVDAVARYLTKLLGN